MTGRFITFEGGEGGGKSTQSALLEQAFAAAGYSTLKTREPGGTPNAETIRGLLVNGHADAWDPVAETLLFYAARMDHVNRLIKPALAAGTHVICDRFCDSTIVYQGIGKKLGEGYVQHLQQQVLGNFGPDLTLVMDMDPAEGLSRAAARAGGENRFESMNVDFHHAVRAGFLHLAREAPERCVVIRANESVEEVRAQVIAAVNERLGLALA
ncbi:MAG: dTMP kinase [Rickettsiales bacterium]|nr:dTMP kinase [Rickettsiales bacterium]